MNVGEYFKIRYFVILLIVYLFLLPCKLFDVPFSTVVTDRNGELLGARIADDGQWRFPPNDIVSEKFEQCLIAFEDRYFYYHFGINPLAVLRALKQNIKAKRAVSGGSTLTMQLMRISRGGRRTVSEKLIEMILAIRVECRYSKKEILTMYASNAPFGGNVVGIEAASWRYFGHPADDLSWAEAAVLAVLPNAPAMIHIAKNRPLLLEKRNKLLKYLYEKGKMDKTDYHLAVSEELPAEPLPLPHIASHLVTGYYLKNRGQKTVSSIDKNLQISVENILERRHSDFLRRDIRNIAALVIDIRTNEVLAYCGNIKPGKNKQGDQVDIIRSPRSTGSILKPFLYYAALDEGLILPHTLLPDIPFSIDGFSPQNFNMQYEGAVPASQVISRSLNVPSVFLLKEYGVPKFYDFLKRAGMTTLRRPASNYGLSLILGGAEATLWDMSFMYSDMARALLGADQIAESAHNIQRQNMKRGGFFKPGAAWLAFDAMKEVNRPEEIDWHYIPSMKTVAWKTGTSYGFRDAWAIGVTSRFVVGVWAGNANGEGKPELVGARTAAPVMFDIFNILSSSEWFRKPENEFLEVEICKKSGRLKGRFCDETDTVLSLPGGLKTESCPYHTIISLTDDERYRVYENCVSYHQNIIKKKWFVLPPVWEWYYKQHHPDYKMLPPFMKGCEDDMKSPMQFIYPQRNVTVRVPKQLDGSEGEITFELAHSNSNATVFWHLNDEYAGTTQHIHKLTLLPAKGKHTLTAVDNDGMTVSIRITVE
ncbi:MAG: penicillin-binding protein 1C [Tannerella sp.]|jgi:penicillin-binding protein 1C|nr:penicillin-binding protein 1C [Tannerella sp.]